MDSLAAAAPATALMTLDNYNPVAVVSSPEILDAFYKKVKAECDAFVPDISSVKGRDAIASLAFKVAKTKTAIDKAGLSLTADWRDKTAQVNAARKDSEARFQALQDTVRKPLTDWERAEDQRKSAVQSFFENVDRLATVYASDTSEIISASLAALKLMKLEVTHFTFQTREKEAFEALAKAVSHLETEHARTLKAEADKIELDRLREAEAARVAEEERRAVEAAETARLEKEKLEQAAKAEREKLEEVERIKAAAEKARLAAIQEQEEKAKAEQAKRDAEYEAAIAEASRKLEEAEAARIEEQRFQAAKIAEGIAQAAAIAQETERRAQDIAHRGTIMKAAKEAIMTGADVTEDIAKRIVLCIAAGNVPSVAISF